MNLRTHMRIDEDSSLIFSGLTYQFVLGVGFVRVIYLPIEAAASLSC